MKVLVTGDRGYIGCVLVPYLAARGHDVVGLDADLYRGCTFPGAPEPAWPSVRKDIRDVDVGDVEGFDAVVHLAALSNDPLSALDERLTYEINHLATVRLAEVAKQAGVERFVFSSSCSLYGAADDRPLDESAAFNPITPYGESKILAERDLSALAGPGFSPTSLRNATAYGTSRRFRGDLMVNNLAGHAFATGAVLIKSDVPSTDGACAANHAPISAPTATSTTRSARCIVPPSRLRPRPSPRARV